MWTDPLIFFPASFVSDNSKNKTMFGKFSFISLSNYIGRRRQPQKLINIFVELKTNVIKNDIQNKV